MPSPASRTGSLKSWVCSTLLKHSNLTGRIPPLPYWLVFSIPLIGGGSQQDLRVKMAHILSANGCPPPLIVAPNLVQTSVRALQLLALTLRIRVCSHLRPASPCQVIVLA